jgi:hypothetical protein
MGLWTVLVQRLVGSNFWCIAAITAPCRTVQLPLEMERVDRPGGIAHHHEFKVVNLTSETIRCQGAQRREAARRTAWTAASCAAETAALASVSCKVCCWVGQGHCLGFPCTCASRSYLLPALIIRCLFC